MAVTEGQLISDGTAVWKVKKIGSEVPAGIMQMFAGNTIPAGWLLCDGSAVSRTDYAKLFSAIGTIYGEGDGSTTFALPNLIDRFLQGSAIAGTYKEAGVPDIKGDTQMAALYDSKVIASGAFKSSPRWVANFTTNAGTLSGVIKFNASDSNQIYGNSTTVQSPAFTTKIYVCYSG